MDDLAKNIAKEFQTLCQKLVVPEYLSLTDAANYCSLNRRFIKRSIEKGELPAADMAKGVGRRIWRIRKRDLDTWIDAYKVTAAPQKSSRQETASKYFKRPS